MNEWAFKNDNFIGLCEILKAEDYKAFNYEDCFTFDVIHFMKICILGSKKYLLNDDDKNENFTRFKFKILKGVHTVLCSLFYFMIFYIVFIKFKGLQIVKDFFDF